MGTLGHSSEIIAALDRSPLFLTLNLRGPREVQVKPSDARGPDVEGGKGRTSRAKRPRNLRGRFTGNEYRPGGSQYVAEGKRWLKAPRGPACSTAVDAKTTSVIGLPVLLDIDFKPATYSFVGSRGLTTTSPVAVS